MHHFLLRENQHRIDLLDKELARNFMFSKGYSVMVMK